MAKSLFVKAEELQELLGISRSESYRIIKKLNDDLKEKGFIVLSGRVSCKYLTLEELEVIDDGETEE